MSYLNWETFWHALWVIDKLNYYCIPKNKANFYFNKSYQRYVLHSRCLQRIFSTLNNKIVGERHRREPKDEVAKWK